MQALDQQVRFRELDDIFDAYLSVAPLAHALFRAAEVEHLRHVSLVRPILDLGCGCGQFAAAAIDGVIDVGVDVSLPQLGKARRGGHYRVCRLADARRLPFEDGQFQTVLSVSVLEHIREPEAVLAEAHRVLAPGGIFAATVVLADLHRHLFYPRLLRRLWLPWLGRLYGRAHDRVFGHHNLTGIEQWQERLVEAGFRIEACKKVVPPGLTRCWDRLLPASWPYLLRRRLGWPALGQPRWFRAWAGKLFQRLRAEEGDEGSVLFVVARKDDGERRSVSPTCPPKEHVGLTPRHAPCLVGV